MNIDYLRFGRKIPKDWGHIAKYPLCKLSFGTPQSVEVRLKVPSFVRGFYNQGKDGACVGFSASIMMSVYNAPRRYFARWLWQRAKAFDNDPVTSEGDSNGTYVFAAFDVLRKEGHRMQVKDEICDAELAQGIQSNYWAQSVDEIRTALSLERPVVIGVNWYSEFMYPVYKKYHGKLGWWIGTGASLGYVMGGHAICIGAGSDLSQGVQLIGSWGKDYPNVWMPYEVLERLLKEDGESCVAIDLPS